MAADTALRLARYFGTTPEVWLNLQQTCDLRRAEIAVGPRMRAPAAHRCVTRRQPGRGYVTATNSERSFNEALARVPWMKHPAWRDGGSVAKARRVKERRDPWQVELQPDSCAAVTLTLPAASVSTADGRELSDAVTVTVAGPPGLSVADARVEEPQGAKAAFAVTLSRGAARRVSGDGRPWAGGRREQGEGRCQPGNACARA